MAEVAASASWSLAASGIAPLISIEVICLNLAHVGQTRPVLPRPAVAGHTPVWRTPDIGGVRVHFEEASAWEAVEVPA